MFIPDPNFFHPGSRIRIRIGIKEFKYLTQLIVSKLSEYDPGCSSKIRILIFYHPESQIQGSKRHRVPDPDPQHG
jgi:hypothetical protein